MEEVNIVLSLFDSADKWKAYIELVNIKQDLVNELKNRLLVELRKVAETNLVGSGWYFYFDNKNSIYIKIETTPVVGVVIDFGYWNSDCPWCKRGVCLWVDSNNANSSDISNAIKSCKDSLPLDNYEDNIHNNAWFPFIKKIPSTIFDVDDSITSMEECLYRAKDNAEQLAKELWKEVFEPFANKECADKFCEIIKMPSLSSIDNR